MSDCEFTARLSRSRSTGAHDGNLSQAGPLLSDAGGIQIRRAAARALTDAIPLIERSEQTTILNVDMGMHGQSAAGLQRLTERLSRHGTRAEYFQIEMMPGKSIGDLLQARASDLGADLMVAGAFGHARIAEKLFGGVTRDLLERMQIPLLLSH